MQLALKLTLHNSGLEDLRHGAGNPAQKKKKNKNKRAAAFILLNVANPAESFTVWSGWDE